MELLYFPRTIKADEALALGPGHPGGRRPTSSTRRWPSWPAGWPPARPWRSARCAVRSAYAASHTFEEALALEGQMMNRTGATADHRAAVAAFVAKEKPVFQGR